MAFEKIPLNALGRITRRNDEITAAFQDVLNSGWYINGSQNQKFATEFSARIGTTYFSGVGNGTDALQLSISAAKHKTWQPKSGKAAEVVTVANAGGYASTACYAARCTPVYCDIEHDDHLLSIESAIAAMTDSTVAVVATHLFGGLVDIAQLRSKMHQAGFGHVTVIEDCAHAHGLDGPNGTAGSLGDLSAFSFYPTKNLGAIGDGGAVLTNERAFSDVIDELRQYGWSEKFTIGRSGGINSRLDELRAAILRIRLKDLDDENKRRCAILGAYAECASERMRVLRCKRGSVAHLAIIVTDDRDGLRSHLGEMGISTEIHYPVLDCDQAGWSDQMGRVGPTGLEVSRHCSDRILSVPCFPGMTDSEVERVCDALRGFRI